MVAAMPSRRAAAVAARIGLRALASVRGHRTKARDVGLGPHPSVILANRSGGPDAETLQPVWPRALLLGEERVLGDLGFPASFLLEPLLAPAAATLEGRLTAALESGFDVLLTADNAPGEPAARCRFRLEAFRTGSPVVAAFIDKGEVRFGRPLSPASSDNQELFNLRDEVRRELDRLAASR